MGLTRDENKADGAEMGLTRDLGLGRTVTGRRRAAARGPRRESRRPGSDYATRATPRPGSNVPGLSDTLCFGRAMPGIMAFVFRLGSEVPRDLLGYDSYSVTQRRPGPDDS
eukprot:681893-Hanusia_phi.AAC.1